MSQFILPARLTNHSLHIELLKLLNSNKNNLESVDIDFRSVMFATPASIVYLSTFIGWLRDKKVIVTCSKVNKNRPSIQYLDSCLFFEYFCGSKLDKKNAVRKTTIPLIILDSTETFVWVESTFVPWLSNITGIARGNLNEVATCLKEIFNNITDHTNYESGYFMGQWYPKQRKIVFSIADFGIGIPYNVASVTKNYSQSDNKAIIKACENEFTSKSVPGNQGAGLYFLLLNIVKNFKGKVTIRSSTGFVEFININDIIVPNGQNNVGYCMGTTIEVVIYIDEIPLDGDIEEEVMGW